MSKRSWKIQVRTRTQSLNGAYFPPAMTSPLVIVVLRGRGPFGRKKETRDCFVGEFEYSNAQRKVKKNMNLITKDLATGSLRI
jgi:hypothetical protein